MYTPQLLIVLWSLCSGFQLGIFKAKTASTWRLDVFASKNQRLSASSKRFASTLDDVEVERLASSSRKRRVVDEFVKRMNGKRTLQKILIANNGMAATKAILSMRQWAYNNLGDERALEFVALATRDDLNANAEFIRLADSYVEVPSGSNKNNYANVDLIVKVAVEQGVDAVWPGWGHASENPRLPNTLKEKGIQFIGPTGPVMAALGDKVSANILAQTAKVPSIPWSGEGIESGLNEQGVIPQDVFNKACIFNVNDAIASAASIGFPVMIKASEGGGGKGIRMANDLEELKTNFVQVQNEVPGSPIFMMQLCTNARHLEVQIIGDEYGNAVALNGRDCSTQRRFQKIFEEGPPVVAPRDIFRQMELSAQRLTQSIGYIGAGTVEYLYNAASNKYYFLELNPRLQVEHPVTEGLTGVNLPSVQLQVAMGIALDRIPEIREFFGRDPTGVDKINFLEEEYVYPEKHVIAARITAENPDEGFKPTSGRIERVKFQSTPKVWGYFSVGANGGIHEFADSQFGHIFASGPTREEARKSLILALKEIDVRGDIRTPVDYLIKLLETQEFKDNTIDTSWLDGIIREKTVSVQVQPHTVALSAAVYRAHSIVGSQMKELADALAKGQTSLQGISSILSFPVEITYDNVKYPFVATTLGPNMYKIKINGQEIEVRVREQPDKSLLCTIQGESYQLFGQDEALGLRMRIDGKTIMIPTVFNPSELRSDVTGKVVRFLQQDGDIVEKDKAYVEIEAMKMIMAVKASESGVISHNLSPGSILGAGDLIATLKLNDPTKVKQITLFKDRLSMVPQAQPLGAEAAKERVSLAMDGFDHGDIADALQTYLAATDFDDATAFFSALLTKFVAAELPFAELDDGTAVSALAKANKDNLASILPVLIAHKQIKNRSKVVLALLRAIEFFGETFGGYSTDDIPVALREALAGVAELKSSYLGEVNLKAKQLVEEMMVPPFQQRLDDLKAEISGGADLKALSKQPNIAVSVDLLVPLFRDADPVIRKSAMEVYIRRVYRALCIKTLDIFENAEGLSASWTFSVPEVEDGSAPVRHGFLQMLSNFSNLDSDVQKVVERAAPFLQSGKYSEPLNALHIGFSHPESGLDDTAKLTEQALMRFKAQLTNMNIRGVNVLLENPGKRVNYLNHFAEFGFREDVISRNMRPAVPQLLELNRLTKNHDLVRMPTVGRNSYMFFGIESAPAAKSARGEKPQVLFLRSFSNSLSAPTLGGSERLILMGLDELERAILDPRVSDTSSSRVFLNILPNVETSVEACVAEFRKIMDIMISKYATRLLKLRVDEIEVKIRVKDPKQGVVPVRLIASSFAGGWLTREAYREYLDPVTGQTNQYCTISADPNVAQQCVMDPYPTANKLQIKRSAARRVGSTYAADFLGLMEVALVNTWQKHLEDTKSMGSPPALLSSFEELVLSKEGTLVKERRFPGTNKIGMLAWHGSLKTPAYPNGREIVVLANDVTVQSGSFGVLEDEFFFKVSEYARKRGIPRVYIACNSGARIGLIDDLKPKFKVQWKDESNPTLGFDSLYLTEEDYKALPAGTVDAIPITDTFGETRYELEAIIGQTDGIGVENLRGSGLIAGETSRAYDETFTLSYVTGRSVGIGAYLNRLGQRVIQMQQGPMILTGFSALNKLLGKEVYTSQDQLGGPQIMYPNGVTHEVVQNDKEGMQAVIDWLSYIPKDFHSVSPAVPISDPPSRKVDFMPTKTPYDPRHMLAGAVNADGSYVSGFFDKGSFKEYLGGWGKSVVTGRARLGGINVGVIAVETRLVEQRIPADPGNPESRESIQPQAGQVWYPDSAFKTAQAIQDFNRGENVPLIIFANWRGFSGGTRDMYGEILKFGAMIVDALRQYKHPVFVYIPPNGELRGGAWVVIDPTINPDKMEMYADKQARGGILEPPGICEVKYRSQEQIATMHRLDPVLLDLDEKSLHQDSNSAREMDNIAKDIKARERTLAPLYMQVAHEFADLHDRAGRMKAKGCISEALEWRTSREFFYWRIRRRQLEDGIKDRIVVASNNQLDVKEAGVRLAAVVGSPKTDRDLVSWAEGNVSAVDGLVSAVRLEFAAKSVRELLAGLSQQEVANLLEGLNK